MHVYVAGPMRGIPGFNFPAFNDATARLRAAGFAVFNPAERDIAHGFTGEGMTGFEDLNDGENRFNLRDALNDDLSWIAQHADAICVLSGWENSAGAQAEMALAAALGLRVGFVFEFEDGRTLATAADALRQAADEDRFMRPPQRVHYLTPEELPSMRHAVLDPGVAAYSGELHRLEDVAAEFGVDLDGEYVVSDEVRVTSSTGGQKGKKPAQFSLIPTGPLNLLAKHYGRGAQKYARVNGKDNWRNGYEFSLSYDAALRHLTAFWGGEDVDPETGSLHVISAAWQCFTLAEFLSHPELVAQFDDRQDGAA
ncbi:hypothetical protein DDP54_15735 (plasmid) [Cellulomonas sp. WB94]|nr:hypothetical protein DDP54_15735 [Cellulomonas sp. WB94]